MKTIICLIWNKRVWKDYTYALIEKKTSKTIKRYAFADILKNEYIEDYNTWIWGVDDELTLEKLEADKETHRIGLQSWGDYRRKDNEDYFVENTLNEIQSDKDIELAVVTDCRFLNEQNQLILFAFKNNYKLLFVKIEKCEPTQIDNHISEQQIKTLFANVELKNDFTPSFDKQVEEKVVPSLV